MGPIPSSAASRKLAYRLLNSKANRLMFCRSATLVWLRALLILIACSWRPAAAKPCLTCRTEACATVEHIKEWCGQGTDPRGKQRIATTNWSTRREREQSKPAQTWVRSVAPLVPLPRLNEVPPATSPVPPPKWARSLNELRLVPQLTDRNATPVQLKELYVPIYRRWWLWSIVSLTVAGVIAGTAAGTYRQRDVENPQWHRSGGNP